MNTDIVGNPGMRSLGQSLRLVATGMWAACGLGYYLPRYGLVWDEVPVGRYFKPAPLQPRDAYVVLSLVNFPLVRGVATCS